MQRFAYFYGSIPCRAPIVVGTEIVAYSTILTLRHFGAKPLVFIDASRHLRTSGLVAFGARLIFGVPSLTATRIVSIEGERQVTGVTIEGPRGKRTVPCDGIVFSGDWVPEKTLIRASRLAIDPKTHGPVIDDDFRTQDSRIFAAGNVLRSARSAGTCALEGCAAARCIIADLKAEGR